MTAVLLLGMAAAGAQDKAPVALNADDTLAPVAWLVGGVWTADVKDGADSTHVENRIRWASNHQAIEFNTSFNGKPHYYGFYAYNPATKAVEFHYTSSEGEATNGTAVFNAADGKLHQDFEVIHTGGKTSQVRSTLKQDGNDGYQFAVFLQKNGEWAEVFKIDYHRKPE
jgi:hypothetical protein